MQSFEILDVLPTGFSIAVTAIAALDTGATPNILARYGMLGDLIRAGGVTSLFALAMYVPYAYACSNEWLTSIDWLPSGSFSSTATSRYGHEVYKSYFSLQKVVFADRMTRQSRSQVISMTR